MKIVNFRWPPILLVLTLTVSCTAANHSLEGRNDISPAELKAGGIAYSAFEITLDGQKAFDNDLSKFSKSINNYDVSVEDNGLSFTFTFKIKPFHGRMLKDGWFSYVVNKDDWVVHQVKQ